MNPGSLDPALNSFLHQMQTEVQRLKLAEQVGNPLIASIFFLGKLHGESLLGHLHERQPPAKQDGRQDQNLRGKLRQSSSRCIQFHGGTPPKDGRPRGHWWNIVFCLRFIVLV